MFLWHDSFWHACLLTLACVLKHGSIGTHRIQICRSGRINCQELKNIWVTLLQTAVARVRQGQRWIDKQCTALLIKVLEGTRHFRKYWENSRWQVPGTEWFVLLGSAKLDSIINLSYIKKNPHVHLLDHKHHFNLRLFKPRLKEVFPICEHVPFLHEVYIASRRLFVQIANEQNPLHHRWHHPQMTPSWGKVHWDLSPQTRWDA